MISICEIDNPTKQINEMYRQRVCGVCFMHCSDQELFSTVADVPVCSCRGVGKYDVNFMKLMFFFALFCIFCFFKQSSWQYGTIPVTFGIRKRSWL